jgi:hypothetical protein
MSATLIPKLIRIRKKKKKKGVWAHLTNLMIQVTHTTVHKCVML